MSKKRDVPTTKHHIPIYDDDWKFLMTIFGNDKSEISPSEAVLQIIHDKCKDWREIWKRKKGNES